MPTRKSLYRWKLHQHGELARKFEKMFGVQFKDFYDSVASILIWHYFVIDLCKFDEWLHEKYGEYEKDNKSMEDCIREHYGKDAAELIEQLI